MKIGLRPKHGLLFFLFILLLLYSIYQARFLILGPRVSIESHKDGQVLESPVLTLEGEAKNVSWISLNDRQIFTDEKGLWSEKLIVSSGTSIMTLRARDRFGRETEKSVMVVLK